MLLITRHEWRFRCDKGVKSRGRARGLTLPLKRQTPLRARLLFLGSAWILWRTRIFCGTGIGCAGVRAGHLLFRNQSLCLPSFHRLVDLRSQRRYVSVQVNVFLRVWIHWLTAKEDGVSQVVHRPYRCHEP